MKQADITRIIDKSIGFGFGYGAGTNSITNAIAVTLLCFIGEVLLKFTLNKWNSKKKTK